MKTSFSFFARAAFQAAICFLLLTGCKKDDNSPPTPAETGAISGAITPTNAITQVAAINSANQSTTTTPAANGIFTLPNLPVGYYLVRLTPAAGYATLPDLTANVTAGGTVDLGNIPIQRAGAISGRVVPATAATLVTATDALNRTFTATPDTTGAFVIGGLGTGVYTVSCTPASVRFPAPSADTAVVTSGTTTNIGAINFSVRSPSGSCTFSEGGTTRTFAVSSFRFLGPRLVIDAANGTERLALRLRSATAPGTYPEPGTYPLGSYSSLGSADFTRNGSYWLTDGTPAHSGTAVVTTLDTTAGVMTGTFSFTAGSSSQPPVSITNGTFNILF